MPVIKLKKELELDPLSKLRIKKHNELVRKFYPQPSISKLPVDAGKPSDNFANAEQIAKESSLTYSLINDGFNSQLFTLRDSLYAKNSHYIEIINKMRDEIEYEISMYMKNARVYSDEERYGGDEKNGMPQGKGILVSHGNIYDGTFINGSFLFGKAIIKTKTSTYYTFNSVNTLIL